MQEQIETTKSAAEVTEAPQAKVAEVEKAAPRKGAKKAKVANAKVKASPQGVPVRFLSHVKSGIVDKMVLSLAGKEETVPVGIKTLPIKAFGFNELTTSLFETLAPLAKDKWEFAYRPTYKKYAFGLIPKGSPGYKAGICQHWSDGTSSICLNANRNVTLTQIEKAIENHKLVTPRKGPGWRLIILTKGNYDQAVKACKEILA